MTIKLLYDSTNSFNSNPSADIFNLFKNKSSSDKEISKLYNPLRIASVAPSASNRVNKLSVFSSSIVLDTCNSSKLLVKIASCSASARTKELIENSTIKTINKDCFFFVIIIVFPPG